MQDINNTAIPLSLKRFITDLYIPSLKTDVLQPLATMAEQWRDVPMLAHTHGQPATPTRVGKVRAASSSRANCEAGAQRVC